MREMQGDPVVLMRDTTKQIDPIDRQPHLEFRKLGADVKDWIPVRSAPPGLLADMTSRTELAALGDCPEFERLDALPGVSIGPEAARQAIALRDAQTGRFTANIVALSAPLVDNSSGHAVLAMFDATYGSDGSRGFVIHMRRDHAGHWQVIGGADFWILPSSSVLARMPPRYDSNI
ncbi:hypothetical protein [Novosphingobium sp.]|uniref:hypothetical protein n=1 Tax=Novosphingobium sp. TaxID=1874826 RepID=UPI0035B47B64